MSDRVNVLFERNWFALFLLVLLGVCAATVADVRLPAIIGDNMVLQRGKQVPIWGWADPNEEVMVSVSWQDMEWGVRADMDGKWSFKMNSPKVGGPHAITLTGNNTVTIKNILVGEVWVCSGQSNMAWSVQKAANPGQEIAAADYPDIRLFTVKRTVADTPQADCIGTWASCSPDTVPGFSAVGYFFGRELHKKLDVPIGLIHTSWGGTPAESWTSAPCLMKLEDYQGKLKKIDNQHAPTSLYNGMIAPLLPYGIAGAIWYQGESNAGRAYQYRTLFPTMIECWRNDWLQGDFPFLFVQLTNFMAVNDEPVESAWAELREAQSMTLSLPNTGMAVIIDIGEANDIHPRNKQDVGKRLSLWALAKTYGKNLVYSGPLYKSMKVDANKAIIEFDHVGGGLVAKDGQLKGFAVAGEDRKFAWADATIEGKTVVVSSDEVDKPVSVRYAWANNPICNLYNAEGLPASPFRTDDWPGETIGNR